MTPISEPRKDALRKYHVTVRRNVNRCNGTSLKSYLNSKVLTMLLKINEAKRLTNHGVPS